MLAHFVPPGGAQLIVEQTVRCLPQLLGSSLASSGLKLTGTAAPPQERQVHHWAHASQSTHSALLGPKCTIGPMPPGLAWPQVPQVHHWAHASQSAHSAMPGPSLIHHRRVLPMSWHATVPVPFSASLHFNRYRVESPRLLFCCVVVLCEAAQGGLAQVLVLKDAVGSAPFSGSPHFNMYRVDSP